MGAHQLSATVMIFKIRRDGVGRRCGVHGVDSQVEDLWREAIAFRVTARRRVKDKGQQEIICRRDDIQTDLRGHRLQHWHWQVQPPTPVSEATAVLRCGVCGVNPRIVQPYRRYRDAGGLSVRCTPFGALTRCM
jgi:hypothetical protein